MNYLQRKERTGPLAQKWVRCQNLSTGHKKHDIAIIPLINLCGANELLPSKDTSCPIPPMAANSPLQQQGPFH